MEFAFCRDLKLMEREERLYQARRRINAGFPIGIPVPLT